jgi:hypothetical protein
MLRMSLTYCPLGVKRRSLRCHWPACHQSTQAEHEVGHHVACYSRVNCNTCTCVGRDDTIAHHSMLSHTAVAQPCNSPPAHLLLQQAHPCQCQTEQHRSAAPGSAAAPPAAACSSPLSPHPTCWQRSWT